MCMESKRFCSFLKYSFYFRHPRLFLALGLGFSFLFTTYRNQNHVTSLSSFDSNLLNIHYRNLESHVLGSKTFHTFFPLSDSYSPSLRKLAIFHLKLTLLLQRVLTRGLVDVLRDVDGSATAVGRFLRNTDTDLVWMSTVLDTRCTRARIRASVIILLVG